MVLSLLDTPSDLVKTQLQNQGVGRKENKMDLTNLQMTKKLYSLKGIPGLYQVNHFIERKLTSCPFYGSDKSYK